MAGPRSITTLLIAATLTWAAMGSSNHPHDGPLDQARTCVACQLAHQPGALPVESAPEAATPTVALLPLPLTSTAFTPVQGFLRLRTRAPPA